VAELTPVRVALVAAVANNGIIGRDGDMPWRLSTDLRRFKRLTMGKPVIMGRKTFEAIGKPLAGRVNIVVTRTAGYAAEGAVVAPDLESALVYAEREATLSGADEIFVIGGGEVYASAIGRADRLYITHVDASPEGDTRFPTIDPSIWQAVNTERVGAGAMDSAPSTFTVYDRIDPSGKRGGGDSLG
jgi:dihydrofolate reductase